MEGYAKIHKKNNCRFTPSSKTVPDTIELTQIKNFDNGLQGFMSANGGSTGEGSVLESDTFFGYGTSGASVKWTYDKTKADWASPGFKDSSEDFYTASGDGFFMWLKTQSAGSVRLEGLDSGWNSVYCDVAVQSGENLVYFPYESFLKKSDNSPVGSLTSLGYHLILYPMGMSDSGTIYVDAFGTYKEKTGGSETGTFTPSTLRLPEGVGLKTLKNFDNDLCGFTAANGGSGSLGSQVTHSTLFGYGESGGSAKWEYDKTKADWASPGFKDSSEEFYSVSGNGFFMWIKANASGTVRLQGLNGDWESVRCDAEVVAGENLVYFPYEDFVDNSSGEKITLTKFGYHIIVYPLTLPDKGTLYIDSFGTYGPNEKDSTGGLLYDHGNFKHKAIENFEKYKNDSDLIEIWTEVNSGETREGCEMSLDTSGNNSVSGNSIKLKYNSGKATWSSPGMQKRKPDNQDLQGDGMCFWMKTEKAMTMRIAYLCEDCEVALDLRNIPAGFEGYVHIPYSEVKYYQSGIETPYEEIGFVPADFFYFTIYAYGLTQSADYDNVMWLDDFGFYSETDFEKGSASLGSVVISGVKGMEVDEQVSLVLKNESFCDVASETDVTSWFNLPKGISATMKNRIYAGTSIARILFMGTVEETANGLLSCTVPANYTEGGVSLTTATNPNAKIAADSENENTDTPDEPDNGKNNNSSQKYDETEETTTTTKVVRKLVPKASSGEKATAKISNFAVEGYIGTKIKNKAAKIVIDGDVFVKIKAGTDVTEWFNLPKGLSAKVKESVNEDSAGIIIEFSGTPKEAFCDRIYAVIGGEYLKGGEPLKVAHNSKATVYTKQAVTTTDASIEAKDGNTLIWIIVSAAEAVIIAGLGVFMILKLKKIKK